MDMQKGLVNLRLNAREMAIYMLAYDFFNALSKKIGRNYYSIGFFKSKDPRKYKYWSVFEEFYDIVKNDSHFNMYWFVEAQFAAGIKHLHPHQILTKTALERYFDYIDNKRIVIKSSEEDDISSYLENDYKIISEWTKNNNKTVKDFFSNIAPGSIMSDGIYYVMMRFISPYFLSISKSFWRIYKDLDIDIKKELYEENELKIARSRIYSSEILKKKAQALFGKEVII